MASKVLSSIIYDNNSVVFTYNSSRIDGGGKTLESIQAFAGSELVSQTDFAYDNISTRTVPIPSALIGDSTLQSRLFLKEIIFKGNLQSTNFQKYGFEYHSPEQLPMRLSFSSDKFGFNNGSYNENPYSNSLVSSIVDQYVDTSSFTADKSVNSAKDYYGALKKITYPTGGNTSITYESNKDIAIEEVPSYTNGSLNFYKQTCTGSSVSNYLEFVSNGQPLNFDYAITQLPGCSQTPTYTIQVFKDNQLVLTLTEAYGSPMSTDPEKSCRSNFSNYTYADDPICTVSGSTYKIVATLNTGALSINLHVRYNQVMTNVEHPVYGGGVRVKEIVNETNGQQFNIRKFFYNSLAAYLSNDTTMHQYYEPTFFDISNFITYCPFGITSCTPTAGIKISINSNSLNSSYMFRQPLSYSTITEIFETNGEKNGAVEKVYTSNPNSPGQVINGDDIYGSPASNANELKKDQLLQETVYDKFGILKNRKNYHYTILSSNYLSSVVARRNFPLPSDDDYSGCAGIDNFPDLYNFSIWTYQNYYGVTKPDVVTETSGFIDGSSVQKVSTSTYGASPYYQLKSSTYANSLDQLVKTEYYFANDLIGIEQSSEMQDLVNKHRINEPVITINYNNGIKISEKHLKYENSSATGNITLPTEIHSKKGSGNIAIGTDSDKRFRIIKYDSHGNILEYKIENGVPSSLLWGYNNRKLIAKIENASYTNISSSLITNAQNLSDSNSESSLVIALNAIRAALPDAMVTTYTHNPLVGLRSVTDCKGEITTYTHDAFSRLQSVKDNLGYLMNEHEYHFQDISNNYNFIKSTDYIDFSTSSDLNKARQSITFYDGVGRSIQQIENKMSNSGTNLITHTEYDIFGRQMFGYLPYKSASTTLDFQNNAKSETLSFYSAFREGTTNPYSEKEFDGSPNNETLKLAAAGNPWAMSNGHIVEYIYSANPTTPPVKKFSAIATWDSILELYSISLDPTANGSTNYDAGKLFKKITKNENWKSSSPLNNTIEEYTDLDGRIVLIRSYESNIAHDTYFVYDQYGNRTYVLTPKADGSIAGSKLDELCYQFKYDNRNRLVEKKLPGKQWEYMVYDKLDRLVAQGPTYPPFSNLTNNGWAISKYDAFDRKTLSLWMTYPSVISSTHRKNLQTDRNNETSFFSETRNSSTPDFTIGGLTYRYTNAVWPTSGYHVLSVNYYDDYNYTNGPTLPTSIEGQPVYYNNSMKPKGLGTGNMVRVITTTSASRTEKSYTVYDYRSRPIRVFYGNHENSPGGYTQTDTKFDFVGKPLYTITSHKRINSETALTIREDFTYDNQSRILGRTHKINSGTQQLLSENAYDELGTLITKKVGNKSNNPLQIVNYDYNVRGWLKSINNVNHLDNSGDPLDLFAYKINYEVKENELLNTTGYFNANIAETSWRSASDNVARKYTYTYDALNRLKSAIYKKPGATNPVPQSYDEYVSYDKNGNILTLRRNGDVDGMIPANEIDDLVYDYLPDSNKLMRVTDLTPSAVSGFIDGGNTGDDFSYDLYGNVHEDWNKGVQEIVYNHMNLPTKVILGSTRYIEFTYNANGEKIEKKVVQNGSPDVITKYLQGFQYVDNTLQFFPMAEGYVTKNGGQFKYIFTYTDQIGNVRMKYSDANGDETVSNTEIIEELNYYPFGLQHKGYNNGPGNYNTFNFQGQERQDDLQIGWDSFKWRNYDYAIGRFLTIDPLAEKYTDWAPYVFSGNRVLDARELEGLEPNLPYNTIKEAAANFGQQYNGWSIRNNKEVATQFYSYQDEKGNTKFSYSKPNTLHMDNQSSPTESPIPDNAVLWGAGHTHGLDNGTGILKLKSYSQYGNNPKYSLNQIDKFYFDGGDNGISKDDKDLGNEYLKEGKSICVSYVFTPSGLVYRGTFNGITGEIEYVVDKDLSQINPSQEKRGKQEASKFRVNDVNSDKDPTIEVGDGMLVRDEKTFKRQK